MFHPLASAILAALVALGVATEAGASSFKDVLETPAIQSPLAISSPLIGVTRAGDRLVAVGPRGHIVFSENGGKTWRQASVPISSDLTSVHFPTPLSGWAVGHDGVVLHSADGGRSWAKQLDGRQVNRLLAAYYQERAKEGDTAMAKVVEEVMRLTETGPDQPFLDVWFDDERTGYVVGPFNLLLTTRDGGRNWQPLMELTDNPGWLHLYAVRRIGTALYIVGEQGLVMRQDPISSRFTAVPTPYQGTFFGVTGTPNTLVVFGLRGNALQSSDQGRSWKKINTTISAGFTAGGTLRDGRIVLVSQGGQMLISNANAQTYSQVAIKQPVPLFGVAQADNTGVALVGARGVRMQALTN